MMSAMTQARAWHGPAVLSYGFRPFFLAGALQAALMVALWVPWLLGFTRVPSALPPVAWHTHELLFGYVPAIVAGFLLTAVPNWTGRMPVVGWPLAGLFALWLVGRLAVALSAGLHPVALMLVTIAFPLALLAAIAREIFAGRNWRNLKVLAGLAALVVAQALCHHELYWYGRVVVADRLAIAATIGLILIVGGRIVPSFTTNWIKRGNPGSEPAPFGPFDRASVALAAAALAAWVALPLVPGAAPAIGALLVVAGLVEVARLVRWRGWRTLAEPLVTVLHVGYAFVPLGFLFAGAAALMGEDAGRAGAVHVWTIGAIGLMTLAVMTRATRGHSGRPLTAPGSTVAIYAGIVIAVVARVAGALVPEWTMVALPLAAVGWVGAFLGFAVIYGPMLLRPRADG